MEITVYSNGDSRDISTWSNVPYLFCKALERKGVKLNRVNIAANKTLQRMYDSFFYKLFRTVLKQNASPIFYDSPIHRAIINHRLRRAAKRYKNADFNLFLSYLFINKYSDKPNVMWCDWTHRIVIERRGRKPKWYENWSLKKEETAIKSADVRYTMFPKCKIQMEELYNVEFRYLNRNVVNTVYDRRGGGFFDAIIDKRISSPIILFIGDTRYTSAALELIDSFKELQHKYSNLRLHIIGMTNEQLSINTEQMNIICHGYLHKDREEERDVYYNLLMQAKVFVNPAAQWGGYSSTIEAMYYGCPVIVSPYDDFVAEFGNDIDFGIYHKNKGTLYSEMDAILSLNNNEYKKMSASAANRVKEYTWDNYVVDFLRDIKSIIKIKQTI